MDGSMLDTLTRLVSAASTRRQALKSALASTAAGLGAASFSTGQAGPKKDKKRKKGCRQWILSGAPTASSLIPQFFVDDDVTVFVNGQIVFRDEDSGSNDIGPLLIPARRGDRLRIVAVDTDPDCHELKPLFLRCACGGPPRKLSDGVPETCPNVAVGQFFDQTFTI